MKEVSESIKAYPLKSGASKTFENVLKYNELASAGNNNGNNTRNASSLI